MAKPKNYGLKVGDKVCLKSRKESIGTIIKIYKAGKHGFGFIHAQVGYPQEARLWMSALSDLEKVN